MRKLQEAGAVVSRAMLLCLRCIQHEQMSGELCDLASGWLMNRE